MSHKRAVCSEPPSPDSAGKPMRRFSPASSTLLLRQLTSLTRLTVAEAIRQPVCLLLAVTCVVFTIGVPLVIAHNFGEGGRLARDGGLAFHFLFGLFIAGYAACTSVAGELRTGTLALVLSKPVARGLLLTAKFLGVVCVILLFSMSASLATLIAERVAEKYSLGSGYTLDTPAAAMALAGVAMAGLASAWINCAWRRSFQSSAFILMSAFLSLSVLVSGMFDRAGHWAPFDAMVQWRILSASLLIAVALIVLASIATTFSIRFSLVPTVSFCIAFFLLGLVSDYCFGASQSPLAAFLYRVIPNWQHFWMADALAGGGSISCSYLFFATLYGVTYSLAILCIGAFCFRRSEVS